MSAYLMVIPWVVLASSGSKLRSWTSRFVQTYVFVFTILYFWIAIADVFVYPEWKQKLNARVLTTLAHPSEVLRTVPREQFIFAHLAWLVFVFMFFQSFRLWFEKFVHNTSKHRLKAILMIVSWPLILGVTARGGTKAIAIDVSRAYFSNDSTLNDAAINPANYLIRNIMQSRSHMFGQNIFASMPLQEAREIKEQIAASSHFPENKILKDGPINLVFIVLESWSADLVGSLGGLPEIAPQFAQLEKESLLFTQFYSNGNRSQQGIASIFGAFPALPRSTITEDPAKSRKLPGLARKLSKAGYETSFLYGGQLEYGNIKSFLIDSGFQTIIEDRDFDRTLPRANLGVVDGEMFKILHDHINNQKQPFFASYFTLNTHAPYDIPGKEKYSFSGLESPYVMSAMYADEELGRFFKAVRNEPWYSNTLFVLVADHSHNTYMNRPSHDAAYRKIPFMLSGGALREEFRGKTWSRIGSQVDIVATVLHQIGMDSTEFEWSRDLFSKNSPAFAYYEIGDGVGWITEQGSLLYDFNEREVRQSTFAPLEELTARRHALAYLQVLFQSFIDL